LEPQSLLVSGDLTEKKKKKKKERTWGEKYE
jgi:hypothetical protein